MTHFVSVGNSLRNTLRWIDEWCDGGMNELNRRGRGVDGWVWEREGEQNEANGKKKGEGTEERVKKERKRESERCHDWEDELS